MKKNRNKNTKANNLETKMVKVNKNSKDKKISNKTNRISYSKNNSKKESARAKKLNERKRKQEEQQKEQKQKNEEKNKQKNKQKEGLNNIYKIENNINKREKIKQAVDKKQSIFVKGKTDTFLLVVLVILLAVGVLTLLSASSSKALSETGNAYSYIKSQVFFIVIGLAIMLFISHINYKIYNNKFVRYSIYIVSILLIFLVKAIGASEGGAKRWITIGGINFQPSEIIKVGMLVFMAGYLSDLVRTNKIHIFKEAIVKTLCIAGFISGMILVLQNHLSAAALIGITSLVQMIVAGISIKQLIAFTAPILAVGFAIVFGSSTGGFRSTRVEAWLNPKADLHGAGWQTIQGLYAIASGGLRRTSE